MSNKIQSDKNVFGFHLFKIGVHLLFFSFFFYSEDTSILIIDRKNKTKQGIKQADKENKNVFGFYLFKIGVHILF